MDSTEKNKKQKELVEEQYTFEEIVEELRISKSSASYALKNLEIRGDIEYLTLPGDRKRYFRYRRRNLLSIIETFQQKTAEFKSIADHILTLKEDKNSSNSLYLKDWLNMIDYFSNKLNEIKLEFSKLSESNEKTIIKNK